jgi:hypothetical protein
MRNNPLKGATPMNSRNSHEPVNNQARQREESRSRTAITLMRIWLVLGLMVWVVATQAATSVTIMTQNMDAGTDMCDGCPDVTYWKDNQGREQLVWSCRLEEPMKYGGFLRMAPRNGEGAAAAGKPKSL